MKTLYKQVSTGKIQQWTVSVKGNSVISVYGLVDGKLQTTKETVFGKNLGKSNETSDEEQALVKATQLFEKKIKEGYVEDIKVAQKYKNVLSAISPMLAFPIDKKEKHVVFPAFIQPKFDGMRCLAVVEYDTCVLYSRSQKVIDTLPHLNESILQLAKDQQIDFAIFDGELYNHEYKDDFNTIMSLIKRDEVHPNSETVEYHIYDIVQEVPFSNRLQTLLGLGIQNYKGLKTVLTHAIYDESELHEFFVAFKKLGYEGAIYRNPNMNYEFKRSVGLLKVKEMADAEFRIIGVNEGKGKLEGHAGAFVCLTKEGKEFKAKLKGKTEDLKEYFVNFDKYKNALLTVQYQDLTPDGIPRFPVGLRIRREE
jgi:DNA ligase-1